MTQIITIACVIVLIIVVVYYIKFRKVMGRYVKIQAPSIGCTNIGDLAVISNGVNVAKGKNVTMSSRNDGFPASNLVDGISSTFAHTSCADKGWVMVDIGSDVPIDDIVIANREDCCNARLNGSVVSVINSAQASVWTSAPIVDKNGSSTPNDGMTGFSNLSFTLPAVKQVGV